MMKYGLTDTLEACDKRGTRGGCYAASLTPQVLRPTNQWVPLTFDIEFRHVRAGPCVQFQFRSTRSDAIDAFVHQTFEEHEALEAKRAQEETERFLYEWVGKDESKQTTRGGGLGRGRGRERVMRLARRRRFTAQPETVQACKRYRLSDSTMFDNLFFEGKAQLIQTLSDFQRRVGKFAPRRFAHRLGLFLHGPSGSGKTSVAKAIAHYTNRHVVNIHASRITTNREMADLLEDLNYSIPGVSAPVELDFKDVVLVIEGVDEMTFAPDIPSDRPRPAVLFSGATKKTDDDKCGDALTLQGFLSALDGVIDTPERVVVLTASDSHRVSPGLVRLGRVHHSVELRGHGGCERTADDRALHARNGGRYPRHSAPGAVQSYRY